MLRLFVIIATEFILLYIVFIIGNGSINPANWSDIGRQISASVLGLIWMATGMLEYLTPSRKNNY